MKKIYCFIIAMIISYSSFAQANDTLAIKQVLEKESATWRSGDIKGHADCWKIQPYSKIVISTADGTIIDIPPNVMIEPPKTIMGKGGTSSNSNYKISIIGNSAWVSHNEESISSDGKVSYSLEFRILEKIEGLWKLVGQSAHMYKKN